MNGRYAMQPERAKLLTCNGRPCCAKVRARVDRSLNAVRDDSNSQRRSDRIVPAPVSLLARGRENQKDICCTSSVPLRVLEHAGRHDGV